MDAQTLCEMLRHCLCPHTYSDVVDAKPPVQLLLLERRFLHRRYALAVCSWDPAADGLAQVRAARRQVAQTLWAYPYFGEVGLYLLFHGPWQQWGPHVESASADRTVFHSVIVQAVHFLDVSGRRRAFDQSVWAAAGYGDLGPIAQAIDVALGLVRPVVVACEECGKWHVFTDDHRGTVQTCPHCAAYVDVPGGREEDPDADGDVAGLAEDS